MNTFFATLFAAGIYSADCDPKLNAPIVVPSASGYSVEIEPNTAQRFCTADVLSDPTFSTEAGGDAGGEGGK